MQVGMHMHGRMCAEYLVTHAKMGYVGQLAWKSNGSLGRRFRAALLSTPLSLSVGLYNTRTAPDLLSPGKHKVGFLAL